MYDKPKLIDALRRLVDAATEAEGVEIAGDISRNVIDPEWSDYLFHSNEFVGTDEQINFDDLADKILSYQAIQL